MAVFAITIALGTPDRVTPTLRSTLIQMRAREIMRGTCLIETPGSAKDVMAQITSSLDTNDAVFVSEIPEGASWAGGRVERSAMAWLKEHRP